MPSPEDAAPRSNTRLSAAVGVKVVDGNASQGARMRTPTAVTRAALRIDRRSVAPAHRPRRCTLVLVLILLRFAVFAALFALWIYAVVDVIRTEQERVRYMHKLVWL